jgi:hypothetical protein
MKSHKTIVIGAVFACGSLAPAIGAADFRTLASTRAPSRASSRRASSRRGWLWNGRVNSETSPEQTRDAVERRLFTLSFGWASIFDLPEASQAEIDANPAVRDAVENARSTIDRWGSRGNGTFSTRKMRVERVGIVFLVTSRAFDERWFAAIDSHGQIVMNESFRVQRGSDTSAGIH